MAADIASLKVAIDSTDAKTAKDNLQALNSVSSSVEGAMNSLSDVLLRVGVAFASWKAIEYAKDTAMLAARYETLGVAMNTVGTTAGYSLTDLDKYENALKATGITALASRESIVKLVAANVDLDKAVRLGQAAQNIAVINNLNSSDAFNKMVQGIQTGQVRLLHSMGIMATFQESYKRMANEIGKTAATLTDYEKVQARTNIVLEYAEKLAGAYDAAMGTVGKQFRSMERYAQDLRTAMGAIFSPALVVIAQALNDMFAEMAQNMAMARASGNFKEWQDSFAKLARAVVGVTQFVVDHKGAIIALVAAYATLSIINTLIPMIMALRTAWAAAVAATVVMDATLGTVVVAASSATAAMNILRTAVAAVGGPWAILAAVVVAIGTALYFASDNMKEMNEKVAENIKATVNGISANKGLLDVLMEMTKVEAAATDQKKFAKDNEEDLAIAKLKILGMGPEYNNALVTEAKSVKELTQAYSLLMAQEYQRKIEATKALLVSLAKEYNNIKPGFWDNIMPGSTGYHNSLMKIAEAQKIVNDKIAAGNGNLATLKQALKDLQDMMKGKMTNPDDAEGNDKKALQMSRKLEDDRYQLDMALLRANKAEGDQEKYNLAIKISQLETDHKILEIRRQFADGKIAGGGEAMKELIKGWKEVGKLQEESAARDLTQAGIKRDQAELKKITDAEAGLKTIMDQVDEVINGGYAKSIDAVVKQYDNFRNAAGKTYELILTEARKADLATGQIMGPKTIAAMTQFEAIFSKIDKAKGIATAAVTAQTAESQYNKITAHLASLEKKHGAMNFDEEIKAATAYAKELGFTKEALKKFTDEAKAMEAQRGNIWGGMSAGLRDFGKNATDIFGNIRKATMGWLDGLSSKLTESIMTGKANFKDFAKSIISDIINMMVKALLFQAIISGMKAMGMDVSWLTASTKAAGGGVNSGQPYLVGENGPELFMPTGSGNIVNNPGSIGGTNVNLSLVINNDGSSQSQGSDMSSQQLGAKILSRVRDIVVDEIQNQKRTGNSLNPLGAR